MGWRRQQFESEGAQNAGVLRRPKNVRCAPHFSVGAPPGERALQQTGWARVSLQR